MNPTDLSTAEGRALFASRINKTETCWIWIGSKFTHSGYGRFKAQGRDTAAHIFSWEIAHGPVPVGLELDHLCRNRICVNPGHLEPVTHRENELRGETIMARNFNKTHCDHGHELSGRNLFIRRNGRRRCQECERIYQRKYKAQPKIKARHAELEAQRRARRKQNEGNSGTIY